MIKNALYAVFFVALGAAGAWMIAASPPASVATAEEWTCGMHPTVVRDRPGQCPICGMDLVPRRSAAAGQANGHNHPAQSIHVDPATRQAIGVRTSLVRHGPLTRRLRFLARVVPDERREAIVTSKYAGWVERIFVNESGQVIRRGERLLSLYSPEVYAGQEELLLAARQGNRSLVESAKERLRSWDVTEGQLKRLLAARRPQRALTRYSPAGGHVLQKHVIDGQYVAAGQPLYQIVDLSRVWVEAEVYEYDVAWLALGQSASLRLAYAPGKSFSGQVAFIYPAVDESSRTVRVRLEFDNPDLVMRPGMFGIVQLEGRPTSDVLHVSDTAVLRSGRRDIVFVAQGHGHFAARDVVLGRAANDGRVGNPFGPAQRRACRHAGPVSPRLRKPASGSPSIRCTSIPASQPASRPASAPAPALPASRPTSAPAPAQPASAAHA